MTRHFRRSLAAAALATIPAHVLASEAASRPYRLVPAESSIRIHVGKTGLLKMFGHEHDVAADAFSGEIDVVPADLCASHASATFDARRLRVLPDDEPPDDVPKVQATMLGPQVLDAERFPQIVFTSTGCTVERVGPGGERVRLVGNLALHGHVKSVSVPLDVTLEQNRLVARGTTTIRQTDFGIEPPSAGGGTVKAANELGIHVALVARPAPG